MLLTPSTRSSRTTRRRTTRSPFLACNIWWVWCGPIYPFEGLWVEGEWDGGFREEEEEGETFQISLCVPLSPTLLLSIGIPTQCTYVQLLTTILNIIKLFSGKNAKKVWRWLFWIMQSIKSQVFLICFWPRAATIFSSSHVLLYKSWDHFSYFFSLIYLDILIPLLLQPPHHANSKNGSDRWKEKEKSPKCSNKTGFIWFFRLLNLLPPFSCNQIEVSPTLPSVKKNNGPIGREDKNTNERDHIPMTCDSWTLKTFPWGYY